MTSPTFSTGSVGKGDRILIIGATGFIGRFIAQASLDASRTTYILIRSFPDSHSMSRSIIKAFEDKRAILLHGDINDQGVMEEMLRKYEIEIVISAVGGERILDQLSLVRAIKVVGTIKRFLPSEFGHEVDSSDPVEPGLYMYKEKREVRRLIEELSIPYTYICCNSVASWPYYDNKHPSEALPPLDYFQIYGDGNVKEKIIPKSVVASLTHDIFIKGCQIEFSIDGIKDLEVCELYPNESFRTMDECFNDFLLRMDEMPAGGTNEDIP